MPKESATAQFISHFSLTFIFYWLLFSSLKVSMKKDTKSKRPVS
jgi:hypothetical protein